MRIAKLVLKIILGLAAAFVAVVLAIAALMGLGVIKSNTPKPKFPSVVVDAPPKANIAVTPLPDRPCVLETTGMKHIALFPDAASAQAFHEVVMAADGIQMLDAPGVFDVIVGTRCTVTDLGSKVSKVRIAEGEHSGAAGWITTEWVTMR